MGCSGPQSALYRGYEDPHDSGGNDSSDLQRVHQSHSHHHWHTLCAKSQGEQVCDAVDWFIIRNKHIHWNNEMISGQKFPHRSIESVTQT